MVPATAGELRMNSPLCEEIFLAPFHAFIKTFILIQKITNKLISVFNQNFAAVSKPILQRKTS